MILGSSPLIGRLCGHTRKWAHQAIRRGAFGPVTRRKGCLYVDLARVEAYCGLKFTQSQIVCAADGVPDRALCIELSGD